MKIEETTIKDLKIISPKVHSDSRGFFMETFSLRWFVENIEKVDFVQDNHSRSSLGTLRGLHYQVKKPQGKLVRVTHGEVYDVAVDLRRSSSTFGKSVGLILSAENKKQFWIPEGFAHGFYVLSEYAEFNYKCTNYYFPEYERTIIWNDDNLKIKWPIIENIDLNISKKDFNANGFHEGEYFS